MSKKLAITGGSRGIGRGIVRRMAKEGYDIAFTYSSESTGRSISGGSNGKICGKVLYASVCIE